MSDIELERELGLTIATVPADAKAGDKVPVRLANGVDATYIVPEGARPGNQLPIRQLPPEVESLTFEINKADETTKLGVVLKGFSVKRGPYIVEADAGGLGGTVLRPGDEIVNLKGVSKASSFNESLIGGAPPPLPTTSALRGLRGPTPSLAPRPRRHPQS